MLRLGITGSIATGKSTILAAFERLGVPVFSADAAVAELYAGEAVAPVEALFPGVTVNGAVDRARLSQALAADPAGFKRLEAVVHPLVRASIARFLDEAKREGADIAVVEVPLLFESGFDYGFDAIGVTYVDPAVQRERALRRPGMSVGKLETILARQMPQDEKKRRADHVFDTGGTIAESAEKVEALVSALRQRREKE